MKLTTLLLIAGCLQLAAKSNAQGISLSFQNASLSSVFNDIEHQSPYRFIYTREAMSLSSKVTVAVAHASIEQVLALCFKGQPLRYTIEDNYVLIRPIEKTVAADKTAGNDVRGKVMNENDEPIAGASVIIKGSQKGTATDNKGEFTLVDIVAGSEISISSVGYETQRIIIGNNRVLNIHLLISVNALEETLIKGYYATSRRLNTGSVSKITAEEISRQPVSNILEAMEGRATGIYIAQATGVAGGAVNVQVRGRNSINAGNNPLFVVDGVPFSNNPLGSSISVITQTGSALAGLNPADIESIEILKDAEATAIYGSRGANGVILITTKKGVSGQTRFNVNLYSGVGHAATKLRELNSSQYVAMRREAFQNDGIAPTKTTGRDFLVWDSTRYTDWQQRLIGGIAGISNAQMTISGGNTHTQFLLSGGFHRESTVFPGSFRDKKGSLHLNVTSNSANQRLKVQLSASYTNDDNLLPRSDPTFAALTLAPTAPQVYDSAGKLNWANNFFNPFGPLLETYSIKTDNLIGNALLSYVIFPGLTIKSSFGYTKVQATELSVAPLTSFSPIYGLTSGHSYFGNNRNETWIIEPQLEYQAIIGNGKFSCLAGGTLQQDVSQAALLMGSDFLDDALLPNIAAAGNVSVETTPGNNYNRQYKYEALFARINYDWKDKYILNLTGRRDGSSSFGPGRQFANFGAAGIGWIFSQKAYIKQHFSFVSFGKLRISYGTAGNDQIPDYGYLSTYTSSPYTYNGMAGLYPARLFNEDYGWEVNKKAAVALELGFLKDKLLFSGEFFRNRSSNQLVGFAVPAITGFSSIQGNLPAIVQNTGLELMITSTNITRSSFHWSTSVNITIPKNKLIRYPDIQASPYAYSYSPGYPLSVQYKYHLTGVNPATGVYNFLDVNKNGSLEFPDDALFLKKITQAFYGGIQNSVGFKKWQLDFLIQVVKQTGYNYRQSFNMPGLSNSNQPTFVLARWRHAGDVTSIQRFSRTVGSDPYTAYSNNQYTGDGNIGDASFGRMKNISLSYTVPIKKSKLNIQLCRFYLQAQNLFTITSYQGLDPETLSSSVLPPLRIVTGGFQLNF